MFAKLQDKKCSMPKGTDISKILIINPDHRLRPYRHRPIRRVRSSFCHLVIPTAAVASRSEATVEWRDLV
jgi:hypothetical protein